MKRSACHPGVSQRGVTLIECAGAALILGIILTAALRAAAAAGKSQVTSGRALAGALLAEGLMNEITVLSYSDPSGSVTIGVDSGETPSNKATFDDVDDYDGWTESPPTGPGASSITGLTKWSRSVRVFWTPIASPGTVSAAETRLKQIEVSVSYSGRLVWKLTALRAVDP